MQPTTSLLLSILTLLAECKSNYINDTVLAPDTTQGLLYPRESETREVRLLDGFWRFLKSNNTAPDQGIREKWYKKGLENLGLKTILMPVPASYNDITTDQELRDHVGTVWYERTFYVPATWAENRFVWLRFGSVSYSAQVWVNGIKVAKHEIGHLPFEVAINKHLNFGSENHITVLCDNRLGNRTIPQGKVFKKLNGAGQLEFVQTYTFDFFNYAGIHRSVHLYTTPLLFISDIELSTMLIDNDMGRVDYQLSIGKDPENKAKPKFVEVHLYDKKANIVVHQINNEVYEGTLLVPKVKPWWPYLMHEEPGYMYTLEFALYNERSEQIDVYRLPVGIRSINWNNESLLINHKPVYFHGFGKHEDSDIRGKGLDFALLARDFNLLEWIGANAYRTSHYPYSEESMQLADEHGIMVIDECSSVNTDIFEPELLQNHMSAIEQLIHRDRNHASVIAWSIANEPRTQHKASEDYFRYLANYTRTIAQGRPLTAATNVEIDEDHLPQFLDIIGFNRYNGWYRDTGRTDTIVSKVFNESTNLYKKYLRPIYMLEYGADTMEGYHALPSYVWAEDYQTEVLREHFKAFDMLRKKKWFIGEFLWNFADFKTSQKITRVGGNKKGIFTREREPKSAAGVLRQRYLALASKLYNHSLPEDIFQYLID